MHLTNENKIYARTKVFVHIDVYYYVIINLYLCAFPAFLNKNFREKLKEKEINI